MQATTVEAWLLCVNAAIHGAADSEPATDSSAFQTATGLFHLLYFADAVGSSGGVLTACLAALETLRFAVTIGDSTIAFRYNRDCHIISQRQLRS